jgi:hypothetical protein
MTNELYRIRKEEFVIYFKVLSRNLPQGAEEYQENPQFG